MFDTFYEFALVGKSTSPIPEVKCEWTYNFRTEKRRYIVKVEEYAKSIYIIKFHAANHSKAKNRHSIIYNDEYAPKIIRTCCEIMLNVYCRNQSASFGFIGAPSVNKRRKGVITHEAKANTQRYRIYRLVMLNNFGTKTFAHSNAKKYSAYLMINRVNKGIKIFKREAQEEFSKIYAANF